ncbi:signal transduction histidine kinase [Desulfosporosinus youngiae DSM 17734]|uniref:Circadian input-output histidine kinase CikA n=2 Tax=Desulfosporosinus TaxID=79206 RepID=H5XV34_9FIRM|nr:signal transduction histidine kinase [Desulfosporosinus youngiae DSM 17734]
MKLKNVLILGIGSFLILLITVVITGFYQMRVVNNEMVLIVNDRYQKVNLAKNISIELGNITRNLREIFLLNNQMAPTQYIESIHNSNSQVIGNISTLVGLSKSAEIDKVAQLRASFEEYLNYEKQAIYLIESNRIEEAKELILNSSNDKLENLIRSLNDVNELEEQLMNASLSSSQNVFYKSKIIFALYVLIGLILGIIISLWMLKAFLGDLGQLTKAMKGITSYPDKTSLPRLNVSKNELGELSAVFNEMAGALEIQTRQQSESTQALKVRNWLQSKVSETHALFQGVQKVEDFCSLLIHWVCQIVESNYGNFYIRSNETGTIKLMASYAGDGQEIGTTEFKLGEGLIGQCFLENRIINLTEASGQYISITTGLGQIISKQIKLLPVEFENQVVAVIELASLSEFSSKKREFLEQVRWNIGIIQNRIQEHEHVQKLLKESQILTEELQTQSELLQTQQEELKTFHEKLEEQYKELELKNIELSQAKANLEDQARQLESSSRYKSEFLSNMSHELRTPLNSLLILSKLLWENKDRNLNSKQLEYAKTIWSSGNDLLQLINDILDLSKIEAGKLAVNRDEVILTDLVKELERQFRPMSLEKGLDFRAEVNNITYELITDRRLLKQILANLLSNAIKFTEQGYVRMHIQERKPKDNMIAFHVTDSGIGIAEDNQDLIFEAFQQADGTTSRKYGGTGLGLSICRELAALLGGYIELKSVEGKGSTFTLYLPGVTSDNSLATSAPSLETKQNFVNAAAKIVNEEDVFSKTAVPGELMGRVVLVVDDDMRNIFAISAALEKAKVKVLYAENGREALEKLKGNRDIELILMDIMMPEMDGYETMIQIRGLPGYAQIPIIALTAKAMKDDREKCLEAGASDYLSKPVDIDKLTSLIRVWLYR